MVTATRVHRDFVPSFQLYGKPPSQGLPDMIHIEAFQDRSEPNGWQIKPHRHFGLLQIMRFLTSGVGITVDGQTSVTTAPAVLVVPPTVVHGFTFSPDVDGTVTTIPIDLLHEADGSLSNALRQPYLLTEQDAVFEQCNQLVTYLQHEFQGRQPARDKAIRSLISCLSVFLDRHVHSADGDLTQARDAGGLAERRIQTFLDLIEAHFTDPWGPREYAAEIGISKGQLTRDCRVLLGRSPLQVIHDRIIKEANRKLAYTLWPVGQICDALGFSDIGYFSRFYRQRTGQTPTQYRAELQSSMTPPALTVSNPR
ncbi:MAG: helix-turn-helix domain-containing protein [Pseudomonadota bacterium]